MTRRVVSIIILLAAVLLTSCRTPGATLKSTVSVEPSVMPSANGPEEPVDAEIRSIVEGFGKQLQAVSLQSPTAKQDMEKAYSAFVSPALLQAWMNNPSGAPGKLVSSPWPDRIEITDLIQQGADRYAVTGDVVEISSTETAGSAEAARIPVNLTVEKIGGRWMITGYTEVY